MRKNKRYPFNQSGYFSAREPNSKQNRISAAYQKLYLEKYKLKTTQTDLIPALMLPVRLTAMPRAFRMFILHMGHVRWSSSHGSTQLLWNKCLQKKKNKVESLIGIYTHISVKCCKENPSKQLLSYLCTHTRKERIWVNMLFLFLDISWNSFHNLIEYITSLSWDHRKTNKQSL